MNKGSYLNPCFKNKFIISGICLLFIMITVLSGGEMGKMKIMTYNIRHAYGADKVQDLNRVVKVISEISPDVLILNEVDEGNLRSLGVFQAKYIAKELGMKYVFGATEGRKDYGNAVLSKYEIMESETFDLPQPKWMKAVTRGCVRVRVEVEGQLLDVYGTHLGLGGFQEIQKELGAIYDKYLEYGIPSVIAGDFNLEYGELEFAVKGLFDDFKSANHFIEKDLYTFPADDPGAQIDYILVSKGIKPVEIYTKESMASDHLPVVCEIEVDFE